MHFTQRASAQTPHEKRLFADPHFNTFTKISPNFEKV